ncbi:MAG: proton-conducting transporter membrane subunit, partial [Vicinamibacterales bacterium]
GVVTLAALAYQANTASGFDLTALQTLSISSGFQGWICATFLVGFIVAMSLAPLRGWLPDVLSEAPPGAAVLLSGGLVKVGAFGLVRFTLPLVPDAVRAVSPYVGGLAIAGVVLTLILAVRQTDWLRVVGYVSMAQAAMTLLGLMTLMPYAVTGAVVLAVTHGLVSAAAIVAVGRVDARLGTRDIAAFRGLRPALSTAITLAVILAALSIAPPIASRVHLPALKVAARVDSRFEAEFLAACDTTVTPALKAASAANQFLAAAPCGPDGKPLGGPVLAPSTSATGAP